MKLPKGFVRNIELWLSAAGLGVIVAVPPLLGVQGDAAWRAGALTAVAVGVLHGVVFWLVRRRERLHREAALRDARRMLQHVVNNQLMVVLGRISLAPGMREDRESLAEATRAIQRISSVINSLSDESVRDWKANDVGGQHYAQAAD